MSIGFTTVYKLVGESPYYNPYHSCYNTWPIEQKNEALQFHHQLRQKQQSNYQFEFNSHPTAKWTLERLEDLPLS